MKITFEASKFETGRAIALAHAINAYNNGGNFWTAEKCLMNFGRAGVYEKLDNYQEYIFAGTC